MPAANAETGAAREISACAPPHDPPAEKKSVAAENLEISAAAPSADAAICPRCRGAVHPQAACCPHCRLLLKHGKVCPQCAETVPEQARLCRFCRYDFVEDPLRRSLQPARLLHEMFADPLGSLILEQTPTNLFRPPVVTLTSREILITRWSWFGLRRFQQKVQLNRIASVRSTRGVIWSSLIIETLGGAISDLMVSGFEKEEAATMAQYIENISRQYTQNL